VAVFRHTLADPVMVGVGRKFIVTVVDAVAEHPLTLVTVTVYVPAAAAVTLVIDGFCDADVNPFGPVQLKVVPPLDVRFNVDPTH